MPRSGTSIASSPTYIKCIMSLLLVTVAVLAPMAAKAQQNVTVFFGSDATYLPFIVAEKEGFYKQEGLNVTQRLFVTGVEAMLSFKTLNANFIASSTYAALPLWHEDGSKAIGVANFYSAPDNQKAISKSSIKTAADLKGKTIATRKGSSSEYFLHTYLKKNNIDPNSVKILDLTPPESVAALVKGDVDALFFWEPTPTTARKALGDRGTVLSTARDYYVERVSLTANKDFAAANPEVVEKFIRATKKAIDFISANPEKAIKIGADAIRADPAIVSVIVDQKPFTLVWDKAAADEYHQMAVFSVGNGRIKSAKPTAEIFDSRYLQKAAPEMVR